jgi:hypothetical protein
MRLRSHLLASCLLVLSVAACSDDGGGSDNQVDAPVAVDANNGGVDAPPPQPDAFVPPTANCDPLDLANAPEVTIMIGQITPNPQAGTLVAGTYELTAAKLNSPLPVTGTAQARLEIVVDSATVGTARLAVVLEGSALGSPFQQDLTGAGAYTIAGSNLTLTDGCGGSDPLPVLQFTATATTLKLWTEYSVMGFNIPIELSFALEQP